MYHLIISEAIKGFLNSIMKVILPPCDFAQQQPKYFCVVWIALNNFDDNVKHSWMLYAICNFGPFFITSTSVTNFSAIFAFYFQT